MQPGFQGLDLLGQQLSLGNERITLYLIVGYLPDTFRDPVLLGARVFYLALELEHALINFQQVVDVNRVVFDPGRFFYDVWMVANESEI